MILEIQIYIQFYITIGDALRRVGFLFNVLTLKSLEILPLFGIVISNFYFPLEFTVYS